MAVEKGPNQQIKIYNTFVQQSSSVRSGRKTRYSNFVYLCHVSYALTTLLGNTTYISMFVIIWKSLNNKKKEKKTCLLKL